MHECILLKFVTVSAVNNMLNLNVPKSDQLGEAYTLCVRYRFVPVLIFLPFLKVI